jgi:acyl-CoA thioesterase-1
MFSSGVSVTEKGFLFMRFRRRLIGWLCGIAAIVSYPLPNTLNGSAYAAAPTILVYGDSLSAAYGLSREQGWAALLQDRLTEQGSPIRVENRSLSGETTYGGLQRFDRVLTQTRPKWVVLQLGANDGLRGLSLQEAERNLREMIKRSRAAGAQVVLVGITMPPNFGQAFTARFEQIYARLQRQEKVPLVPLLIDGFAQDLSFFQTDQIHPNAQAQPIMLENVWKVLAPLVQSRS